ncbi:MAG TPA: DUF4393 domain-containing protein [Verrucomicrobiae bacterium]|nr:DUF4393 domain-containing protein [Verrucomicrobiae bacterium]
MEPLKTLKIVTDAAEKLGLDELAPTVYEDLLQPAARVTGQNLVVAAKVVEVALAPLSAMVWGYDLIKKHLSEQMALKLAGRDPEEIQSPDPVIAGPIILSMSFASQAPHLREMYANLLATAMLKSVAEKAHPSFVFTIQQLCPAEAKILDAIANGSFSIEAADISQHFTNPQDAGLVIKDEWRKFCARCGITDSTMADAYRNNLTRLGILADSSKVIENLYAAMTGISTVKNLGLSDYGNLFLDICVRQIK